MCGSEKKIVTNSEFLRRKRIWDEKKGRFLVFLYNASIQQGVSYCNGRNEMALRDTRVTNFVESWCLTTVQKEHEPNRARTKGFMPSLVCALFCSSCFWIVPFLVFALFGLCCFWFVLFLVHAHFCSIFLQIDLLSPFLDEDLKSVLKFGICR